MSLDLPITVDLGNGRLKARVPRTGARAIVHGGPVAAGREDHGVEAQESPAHDWLTFATGPGVGQELVQALGPSARARGAALSSVAAEDLTAAVRTALERACDGAVLAPPPLGLRLDVDSPETVGIDRLCAARGALVALGREAIVVDAGTALTVDAVRPTDEGRGLAGVFLGGAIAPGPHLLAAALERGAARLPRIEPIPNPPALGRDTRAALRAGVGVGFAGAALALVAGVAEAAGFAQPTVLLTGGTREFLTHALNTAGWRVLVEPDLIHVGLSAAYGDAVSR